MGCWPCQLLQLHKLISTAEIRSDCGFTAGSGWVLVLVSHQPPSLHLTSYHTTTVHRSLSRSRTGNLDHVTTDAPFYQSTNILRGSHFFSFFNECDKISWIIWRKPNWNKRNLINRYFCQPVLFISELPHLHVSDLFLLCDVRLLHLISFFLN